MRNKNFNCTTRQMPMYKYVNGFEKKKKKKSGVKNGFKKMVGASIKCKLSALALLKNLTIGNACLPCLRLVNFKRFKSIRKVCVSV